MRLLSVMDIFSAEAVQALCWTLVHSLWQGLILAGIVALAILFTKKSKAAFRYHLFTGSFIFFILAVSVTFYLQIDRISTETTALAISLVPDNTTAQNTAVMQQGFQTKASAGLDALAGFFNQYAAAIVFCWLLIISLKCVKLFAGLYNIQQIKRRHTSSVGSYWSLRVQQLSAQLGIKGHVQFLQSGIAKVPMVIGHFKPIIFFPLGALTALAPEDVEAILMHELAHIRRRDYLVNLLQHFAEIIFFFNPAVLWVSALIKTERENCCDDIALQQMGNKKTYINALVSFQEFDATLPVYATAFSNKKEYLLQRVKRMVYNNNKSLNNMEKIFIAGCIFLTATMSLVYAQAKKAISPQVKTEQGTGKAYTPEVFKPEEVSEGTALAFSDNHPVAPRTHFVFKKNGVLYETYGDRTWLKVNGELIPKDQWNKYNDIVNNLIANYHESIAMQDELNRLDTIPASVLADKKAAEEAQKVAEADKKLAELDKKLQELNLENEKKQLVEIKAQLEVQEKKLQELKLESEKKQLKGVKKQLELQEKELKLQKLEIEKQLIQQKQSEVEREKEQKQAEKAAAMHGNNSNTNTKVSIRKEVDTDREHIMSGLSYSSSDYDAKAADYEKLVAVRDAKAREVEAIDMPKLLQSVTTDLINEKVITKKEDLSYMLSNESLVVNGKAQPDAVHQKLKAKYIKSPDWKLMYNWRAK